MLEHVRTIAGVVYLPVNADFESGFATDAGGVAESVRLCVATGVAGLSIEDATGNRAAPLFDLDVAVERLRAARAAIDATGTGVVRAVAPRSVNVLAGGAGFSVAQLRDLGVRRISVGAALARAAWGAFLRAAEEIAGRGTFESLAEAATFTQLNALFADDVKRRKQESA